MYPFAQSVAPAFRSHIDAQIAFLTQLSQTMSASFQQAVQLNMQLGQSLVNEAIGASQRMLTAERPADALSAAVSRAQPVTDRLSEYQQQLSQLAATTQVDLTRMTEQRAQETSRTARAQADDLSRATVEETGKDLRQQEETVQHSPDAFKQEAERATKAGAQFQGAVQGSLDAASGKPDGQAGPLGTSGNVQGSQGHGGNKLSSPSR